MLGVGFDWLLVHSPTKRRTIGVVTSTFETIILVLLIAYLSTTTKHVGFVSVGHTPRVAHWKLGSRAAASIVGLESLVGPALFPHRSAK